MRMVKDKNYQARGEALLDEICMQHLGIPVNKLFGQILEDLKDFGFEDNVYDSHILAKRIHLRTLEDELKVVQESRKLHEEKLASLKSSENELMGAIESIRQDLEECQDSKKELRRKCLNNVFERIVIEYDDNKEAFNSIDMQEVVYSVEIDTPQNNIVRYLHRRLDKLQESLDESNTDVTLRLSKDKNRKQKRVRLDASDIAKLLDMLKQLSLSD